MLKNLFVSCRYEGVPVAVAIGKGVPVDPLAVCSVLQ